MKWSLFIFIFALLILPYRIGAMTARKYRSNSSGVCFIRPLIHHSTISTKLPVMWFTRKSCGISVFAVLFWPTNCCWISSFKLSLKYRRKISLISQESS